MNVFIFVTAIFIASFKSLSSSVAGTRRKANIDSLSDDAYCEPANLTRSLLNGSFDRNDLGMEATKQLLRIWFALPLTVTLISAKIVRLLCMFTLEAFAVTFFALGNRSTSLSPDLEVPIAEPVNADKALSITWTRELSSAEEANSLAVLSNSR